MTSRGQLLVKILNSDVSGRKIGAQRWDFELLHWQTAIDRMPFNASCMHAKAQK